MRSEYVSVWRLLKPQVRPRLGALGAVVLFAWISALAQRAVILLLEPTLRVLDPKPPSAVPEPEPEPATGLIDRLGRLKDAISEWLVGQPTGGDPAETVRLVLRIGAVVLGLAIVIAIAQYAFRVLTRWVALRMIVDLRMRLARHLMALSMQYHGRRRFGDLLSRVSNDVGITLNMISNGLKDLVQQPLLAITALLGMLYVAPIPTLVLAVGLPVMLLPIALLANKVRRRSTSSLESLGSSVQTLSQMFQGVRTVKSFRAEERELEAFREANETYVHDTMRMARAIALTNAWSLFFGNAGMGVLIVLLGGVLAYGFFDSVRDMATFVLFVSGTFDALKATVRVWTEVQESMGAAVRLQALLDEPVEIVDREGAVEVDGLGAGVRFDDVSFAYADGDGKAIDGLSLELRTGEMLALVGPSGAGKSTLVDLVARLIDPSEGRVTVDGVDLRDVGLDSWTRQYAMVGQTPFLFHASIEENIRYGRPDASRAEVEAAARAAGIHDFITGLPEGYATNVADTGSRLSGGQRQRITIARAFLKEAPLLLLDEATSALDTESEAVVQEALQRLMADRTVLVIAHRLSTIQNADRIAVLDQGRLVELGTHAELVAAGGLYARLSKAQELGTGSPPRAGAASS